MFKKKTTEPNFKIEVINGEQIGDHITRSGRHLDFFVDEGHFSLMITNNTDGEVEYDLYYLDNGEVSMLPDGCVGFLTKGETEIIEGPQEGRFEWKTFKAVRVKDKQIPSKFYLNFYEEAKKLDLVSRPITVSGEHEGLDILEEKEFHRGLRHPHIITINGI